MMLDNPRILVCPFCGKEKRIMSLLSGNNLGARVWSDNKHVLPMMPESSYVQKCPQCGKYYITGRQEVKLEEEPEEILVDEDISFDQSPQNGQKMIEERFRAFHFRLPCFDRGLLTYTEMKEAFDQLLEEGFVNKEEECQVRMMLHHAYNDYYYRDDDDNTEKEVNADDKKLFCENAIWLIHNYITDDVLKAEFYREIGEFETARSILDSVEVGDAFLRFTITQIQKKLQDNDCIVFEIN